MAKKLPDSGVQVAVHTITGGVAFGLAYAWLWCIYKFLHVTWSFTSVWDVVVFWMLFDRVYAFSRKMADDVLSEKPSR